MNRNRGPQQISWQRVSLIALCALLALVLSVLIFGTAYVHHLLSLITGDNGDNSIFATLSSEQLATATEDPDDPDPSFTGPSVSPSDVVINTIPSIPVEDLQIEGVINIMLVGEDRRPGQGRQRSDSMMLCSFNTNKNSITMTSFLRDTYIPKIPGYWADKMNAAYAYGGVNTLDQTLAAYFGVHVDANIVVHFYGFVTIIDMLGGVDIELTQKEADHLNNPKYADTYGTDIQKVHAGMNHLDGKTALAYSRIRKLDMDAMRAKRQRKVLTSLINAYKSKPLGEMLALTSEILQTGCIQTDMTPNEVLSYVAKLFPMLSTATLNSQQMPAEGTYQSMTVGSVTSAKVCDFEANRKILQNFLQ